jgi:tRNA (cytidine/uridine-2'-O-)-methyltransferase
MSLVQPWGRTARRRWDRDLVAPLPGKRKPAIAGKTSRASRFPRGARVCTEGFLPLVARHRHALALYQPDIAQNTGTILRLCACLGMEAHIIEPAGFPVSDRAFRRAGMDYLNHVSIVRHISWPAFEEWRRCRTLTLVLLTTQAPTSYLDHRFDKSEILLLGRESSGVPAPVHQAADVRLAIPMQPQVRSLNVALAAALVTGEALRQTHGFAAWPSDDRLRPSPAL